MRSWYRVILNSIIGVLLIVIVMIQIQNSQKIIIKQTFPESVNIQNNTFYKIDTIAKVLANKILGYDSINVLLAYMVEERSYGPDMKVFAYVIKLQHKPNTYIIFLSKNIAEDKMTSIIAHEFAHIEQFESDSLQIIDQNKGWYLWKQKAINLSRIPYFQRDHEEEARNRSKELYKELYDRLYVKDSVYRLYRNDEK